MVYILISLLAINIVCLKFITEKLKFKNNNYISATIISIVQFFSYGVTAIIVIIVNSFDYGWPGTPAYKGRASIEDVVVYWLIIFCLPFLMFHLLCKNTYDSKFTKNILMYSILFFIFFVTLGLMLGINFFKFVSLN